MNFCFPNKPMRIYSVEALTPNLDLSTWIVQPKWDGHRALPWCDENGRVTVYSRMGTPLKLAGNNFAWLGMLPLPRPWGLDAELTRDGRMIVWDFSTLGGHLRIAEPYFNRLQELETLIPRKVSKQRFSIEVVETLPANSYRNFMLRRSEPSLEGFVLKNPAATDMWGPYRTTEVPGQFKLRF